MQSNRKCERTTAHSFACQIAFVVLCCLAMSPTAGLRAQDAETEDSAKKAREARAREMVDLSEAVRVYEEHADGKRKPLARLEDPILRFNDEASPYKFRDGTLWVFADNKRPRVLLSLERYEDTWGHELVSLSEAPTVSAITKHEWEWSPREAGLEFQPFPDQPPVDDTPEARLRKQKALARKFEVGEIGSIDGEDYQLRLMPAPVYTYEDANAGILSGGIYVFAYGTNPEAVLVIEARDGKDQRRHWQFAFNLLTAATPTARLDGKEVWQAPDRSTLRTNTPYTHYSYPAPVLGKDDE